MKAMVFRTSLGWSVRILSKKLVDKIHDFTGPVVMASVSPQGAADDEAPTEMPSDSRS
jgi:hypothetical protein